GTVLGRLADGHGHAAVLERTGGVEALDLEEDLASRELGYARGRQQGCAALLEGDDGGVLVDGKAVAVLIDDASPRPCHAHDGVPFGWMRFRWTRGRTWLAREGAGGASRRRSVPPATSL